jgi:hypothetical protein
LCSDAVFKVSAGDCALCLSTVCRNRPYHVRK